MIETKVRRIGETAVMTLTPEMLTLLKIAEGDTIYLVQSGDGTLRILASDPDVAAALEAAETVMDENRDLLQKLA
ncbi:transcriptional regulator/antitoxin MazE [Histidinibacterium lentulum]|uniref:Transcriptional regulator/antitoxin MazE n=1 Tax=Histidinibacterium lentulum TaxID=2480588 RepID=A0A3N2R5K4_9RHOB|nr:transcriptional regulator/antitoxin MazE [Histidinibacterium lentulum]ROU02641.1 transcriptional regulator/antitoxin MazE [Histidinibacterium lentulum]